MGLGQHKFIQELKRIGYQTGLSFQTVPYNWYYGLNFNELNPVFENVLKRLYKYTGKKTTIVAHSFGTVVTMKNLLDST